MNFYRYNSFAAHDSIYALSFTLGRLNKYSNDEENNKFALALLKKLLTNFDPNIIFLWDAPPFKLAHTNLSIVKLFVENGCDMRPLGRDIIKEALKHENTDVATYVEEQQKLQLSQRGKCKLLAPVEMLKKSMIQLYRKNTAIKALLPV